MKRHCDLLAIVLLIAGGLASGFAAAEEALRINQIQFVGSHNSYKQAMHAADFQALQAQNPQAAAALEYEHLPLDQQLDLGMRVLEIDLFYQSASGAFPVGHVQQIDMNSHCADLLDCLAQVKHWSRAHPQHVPIWLMFNLKDQVIDGLPEPEPFTAQALKQLDEVFTAELAEQLIWPDSIVERRWPTLDDARGKILLLLDEGGTKRDWYLKHSKPTMFANAPRQHPRAAVMVVNDPVSQQQEIQQLVRAGFMVRTRADANTVEARAGDTRRRQAAFSSGAQAVSTDYYLPATHFGSNYQVSIDAVVQCNPVSAPQPCTVTE